ncbi:NADAR family protein [Burkholderia cenocepacia]|uniref:NADAR family protein n=1 Tax=Burkholderia cenocepacia TaxID=95486 RepID=UPI00076156FF|nr:NADAR family protein [Burkholderia cenocepacia]KWU19203.1 hypothetical protein AS149_13235 [Burkholderia cenocepacia]
MQRSEIVTFWGSSSPFSNWNLSSFIWNDIEFNCGEQYMMWRKAMLFGDTATAALILDEPVPSEQKKLGRKVAGFVKEVWDAWNIPFMVEGLLAKFSQNQRHGDTLVATDDKFLIEASPVDTVWGAGLAASDTRILDERTWRGENRLGVVLMCVRTLLRALRAASAPGPNAVAKSTGQASLFV